METITIDDTPFSITPSNAVEEIRNFCLQQLAETDNLDAAHRLANLWGMEYCFDEEAVRKAQEARRLKYLQWEDLLAGNPPDLISTPEDLVKAMNNFTSDSNVFGFDTEWSEDDKGADILQIANLTRVLLIDLKEILNFYQELEKG